MTFQAPKGVSEYLPPRGALFAEVRDAFAESARRACYADVETAVFEDTALFVRGVGAETIAVAWDAYQALGLQQLTLLLNSLGDKVCRPVYREALQRFLRGLDLDADTRLRIEINPLRVLDDKRPEVRAQTQDAPVMTDYLCAECKAHHDTVRGLLVGLGIPYTDAPRLVRGLDYYTRTTYEFDHALLGAQSGIGGGGRYDGLSEDIGGGGAGVGRGQRRAAAARHRVRGRP